MIHEKRKFLSSPSLLIQGGHLDEKRSFQKYLKDVLRKRMMGWRGIAKIQPGILTGLFLKSKIGNRKPVLSEVEGSKIACLKFVVFSFFLLTSLLPFFLTDVHAMSVSVSRGEAEAQLVAHWPLSQSNELEDTRSLDNSSDGTSYVASTQAYGTWEFDIYNGVTDNTPRQYFISSTNDHSGNRYSIQYTDEVANDARLRLIKDAGILWQTANDYAPINTWYRIKVVRTSAGVFTAYIKGGTFGDDSWTLIDVTGGSGTNPITDTTYTSSAYFVSELDSGDKLRGVWTSDTGGIPVSDFTTGTGTFSVTGNLTTADLSPTGNDATIYGATYTAGPTSEGFGPELVTNGEFDDDSDWNTTGQFTISGGKGNLVTDGTYSNINQPGIFETGKSYIISFDITDWVAGTMRARPQGHDPFQSAGANGHYEFVYTGIYGTSTLYLTRNDACNMKIDNVSVREIVSGQALDFDGTNDYVSVASPSGLDFGTDDFSYAGWIRTDTTNEYAGIIAQGSGVTVGSWSLQNYATNSLYSVVMQGVDDAAYSHFLTYSPSYSLGEWIHVAGVISRSGNTLTLSTYKNGEFLGSEAKTIIGTVSNATPLKLGNSWNSSVYFDGAMADIKLYNHALTASEISTLYEGGTNTKSKVLSDKKGLVGQWLLNKKSVQSDTRSLDNSGSGTSYISSSQAYGTWEFDMYKGADGNNHIIAFISNSINTPANTTGYSLWIESNEQLSLYEDTGVGLSQKFATIPSYIANSTWYRLKVTRSTAGVFTVYIKGGAFGSIDGNTWTTVVAGGSGTNPVTDTTYTTSAYMVADLDAGDKIRGVWTSDVGGIPVSDFTDGTGTTSVTGNLSIADDSPAGNDGTVYNAMITPAGEPTGTFTSSDDVVIIPDSPSNEPDNISVSFWGKFDIIGDNWVITKQVAFDNSNFGYLFRLDTPTNQIRWRVGNGTTYSQVLSDVINPNQWYHFTGTYDSSNIELFVNGVSLGTSALSGGIDYTGVGDLYIGEANDLTQPTRGQISDIRLFNRALTDIEIEQVYEGHTITDGLTAWYPLTEGAGDTAFDVSVNENHGSIENATLSSFWANTQTVAPFNQKEGYSHGLYFDGVDDVVTVGDVHNFNGTDFSLSIWVKTSPGTDTYNGLFSKYAGNQGYDLILHDGIPRMALRGTSAIDSSTGWSGSADLRDNKWHLVTTVNTSTGIGIYIDGAYKDTVTGTWTPTLTTNPLLIGGRSGLTPFKGNLSDARVYNRALNTDEVADLYNHQTVSSGLVGQWLLDEGTGTAVTDSGSGGTNGTITGSSWTKLPKNSGYNSAWWKGEQVMQFDGVDDSIDTGTDIIGTGDVTVAGWIKPSSFGENGGGRIIDNGELLFLPQDTNDNLWFFSDGSTYALSATNSISLNEWQFVAVTRTSVGTTNFYIGDANTVPTLSGTANQTSGTPTAGTTNIIIGNNTATDRSFDGQISDLRIFDSILTTDEITTLYNRQSVSDGLVAHYPLDANNTDNTGYASFDGVNDKVSIAGLSGTTANSFSAWVKPITGSVEKRAARLGGSGNIDYNSANGAISYQAGGLADLNPITYVNGIVSTTLILDQWNHLAVTFDDYTLGTIILAGDGGSSYTEVFLGDVSIYNRALSASEISSLYHNQDVTTSLVGHWPLETDYNDDAGSNNGTNSGSTLISLPRTSMDAVGFNDGIIQDAIPKTYLDSEVDISSASLQIKPVGRWLENSMYFDGDEDYVTIPSQTYDLDSGTTFSFWSKRNNLVANIDTKEIPLGSSTSAALQYIMFNNDGKIYLETNTNADYCYGTPSDDTDWHHYVFSVENNTCAIYEDGVSLTMIDDSVTDDITLDRIGGPDHTYFFDGNMADVRIYDRALNATEVSHLYETSTPNTSNPKGRLQKGLVGYWPLKSKYEKGTNLVSGWDFTSGWGLANGNSSIVDSDTFSSTAMGGLSNSALMTVGKTYRIIVEGTVSSGTFRITDGVLGQVVTGNLSGTFSSTVDVLWTGHINLVLLNNNAATTDITKLIVTEITTADTTPQSNHGTLYNGPTVGSDYTTFDGTDDYVNVSTDVLDSEKGSISAWYYPTENGGNDYIFMTLGSGTNRFYLQWQSNDLNVVRGNPAGTIQLNGTTALNTWYHMILTWSGSTMSGYLDGVKIGTTTFTNPGTDPTNFLIGNQATDYLPGRISGMRMYDRPLTDQEAKQLYEQGR